MSDSRIQPDSDLYYNRDQLYREVWEEAVQKVAKRYGISDVALAKTCRKLKIPLPGRGYWAKKASGHNPPRISLPSYENPPKIYRTRQVKAEPISKPEPPPKLVPEAFDEAAKLLVKASLIKPTVSAPESIQRLHPYVSNTRKILKENRKQFHSQRYAGDNGRISSWGENTFQVTVGPESIDRVIGILQALCDVFNRMEFTIGSNTGKDRNSYSRVKDTTYVSIMGEQITFRIFEHYNRHLIDPSNERSSYRSYEYTPSGKFSFEIDAPSWMSDKNNWHDGNRISIEAKLDEIIAGCINTAAWKKEAEAHHKQYMEKQRKEEELRRERERIERIEQNRVDDLKKRTDQWTRFLQIKSYVDAIRMETISRMKEIDPESEIGQWLNWADKYLEKVDPMKKDLPTYSPPVYRIWTNPS